MFILGRYIEIEFHTNLNCDQLKKRMAMKNLQKHKLAIYILKIIVENI